MVLPRNRYGSKLFKTMDRSFSLHSKYAGKIFNWAHTVIFHMLWNTLGHTDECKQSKIKHTNDIEKFLISIKINRGRSFTNCVLVLRHLCHYLTELKKEDCNTIQKHKFFPVRSVYNIFVAKIRLFILLKLINIFTFIHRPNQIRLHLMLLSITTLLKFHYETQSMLQQ